MTALAARALSARAPLALGLATLLCLGLVLALWLLQAPISGAVIAQGRITVAPIPLTLASDSGGTLARLLVTDGAQVAAGTPLVELDGTEPRTTLASLERQDLEAESQIARLTAERDGTAQILWPAKLARDPACADLIAAENRLYFSRKQAFQHRQGQLARQQAEIGAQRAGLRVQARAIAQETALTRREWQVQSALLARGLAQAPQVLSLERSLAQLAGQAGQNAAARAMAAARMSQTDFLRRQEAEERRKTALEDLRRLRAEGTERAGRIAVLRHRIAALTLRAPVAGVVYDLRVSGPGMVLRPAEPVLSLHPTGRPLTVRARIPAAEAARLHPGQPAHLTIPAFRAEHLPDLEGHLRLLSPDTLIDPRSGQQEYSAEITLDPATLPPFGPDRLRAGLPVEVYLDTGSQSAISWLLAPVRGYFRRAFREN